MGMRIVDGWNGNGDRGMGMRIGGMGMRIVELE